MNIGRLDAMLAIKWKTLKLQSILCLWFCLSTFLSAQLQAQSGSQQDALTPVDIQAKPVQEAKIDKENFELGIFLGLLSLEDFGVNALYGVKVAYHITPRFFFESEYGQSKGDLSSFERLSGSASLLTDQQRRLQYYNLALAMNLLPGEAFFSEHLTFNHDFYARLGAGSSDFAGNDNFTVSVGLGFRWIINDALALRMEMQDYIFDLDVLGENETQHNLAWQFVVTGFF